MQKKGYVVFSNEEIAKIRIKRESSCGGNCSHCKGCGTDELVLEVENIYDLKTGETVNVYMEDKGFIKKAFIGYGLLVFLAVFGAVLGYGVFENELVSFVFLIVFFVAGLSTLKVVFKRKSNDIKIEKI